MATLAVQDVNTSGIGPTYAAASGGGDQFPNDGRTLLHVKNGSGAPITVTVASQRSCDQGSTHNTTVSVPASGERMIGPFPTDRYSDSNGFVQLTYSGVTSLTVAALSL
jgi:hypothetical protein